MRIKPVYRLWMETEEGERVFGRGPYELLKKVDETGSLNKAAAELQMSYSKAFHVIKNCEANLGIKFLNREIGGVKGGGSTLTDEGKEFMRLFEKAIKMANEGLKDIEETINKNR